jgi:hypothetical protein
MAKDDLAVLVVRCARNRFGSRLACRLNNPEITPPGCPRLLASPVLRERGHRGLARHGRSLHTQGRRGASQFLARVVVSITLSSSRAVT